MDSLLGSDFRVAIAVLMMANKFVDECVCPSSSHCMPRPDVIPK